MLNARNHARIGVGDVRGESTEGPTEPCSKPSYVCTEPVSLRRSLYLFPANSRTLWHPTNKSERSANQVELRTDAFTKMSNLILLKLNNVEIKGTCADFPRRLKYFSWQGFPLTSIPTGFPLDTLVDLDLQYSKLKRVFKGKKLLTSLKSLNLSYSRGLKNTPVFTQVPNLERLVLKHCISLIDVDVSIGELQSLVFLNLEGCKKLKNLPREVGNLTSLETLILSGCSKLDQLPAELGQMKSLTVLNADGNPQDIGEDGPWTLVLKPTKSPKTFLCLPSSLVKLSLSNCNLSSDGLGNCLGSLSLLLELDLSKNPISRIPESITDLTGLIDLDLSHCTRLQSLPELQDLNSLMVDGCSSLETIEYLPPHTILWMEHANKLVDVGGRFKLEALADADAEIINGLGFSSSELEETIGSLEVEYCALFGDAMRQETSLQVLHECGIYSIFLPWQEVPRGWRSSNRRMGSSISLVMPFHPYRNIQALKIYVVLVHSCGGDGCEHDVEGGGYDYITVNNVSKGLKWAYTPWFMLLPPNDGVMVWLSHWNHLTLEIGDEVEVSAGFRKDYFWVMEIGVQVVYAEPKENQPWSLSIFELVPGHYHLCRYGKYLEYVLSDTTLMPDEKTIFGE